MMTAAGEELMLSLLLRGVVLRLYQGGVRTDGSPLECVFDGYDGVKLDESNWSIRSTNAGLEADHPKVSFECSIGKRSDPICVGGFYLTRGTTVIALAPFTPPIECKTPGLHRIDVTPQFVSRDNGKE